MELISASRIARAQQRVAAARPYSEQITAVIANLASAGAGMSSPLLQAREATNTIAYVIVAADRGLAGAYNSNIIRLGERAMRAARSEGKSTRLIVVGKKAQTYFRFRGEPIDAEFLGMTDQPTYENAREIAAFVTERFESGEYDAVQLVYTQFFSVGTQRTSERRFMPLDPATNHLAKQTEDHPLAYATFGGDIPKGEYGGGHVAVWDSGTYELEKWQEREVKVVLPPALLTSPSLRREEVKALAAPMASRYVGSLFRTLKKKVLHRSSSHAPYRVA